jgi:hypothetical protein
MNGLPYKDTFAAKGSQLYEAITEGRDEDAKKIYADTTARYHALLNGLSVPKVVVSEKNPKIWAILADDAEYDKQGRLVKKLEKGGNVDVKV